MFKLKYLAVHLRSTGERIIAMPQDELVSQAGKDQFDELLGSGKKLSNFSVMTRPGTTVFINPDDISTITVEWEKV